MPKIDVEVIEDVVELSFWSIKNPKIDVVAPEASEAVVDSAPGVPNIGSEVVDMPEAWLKEGSWPGCMELLGK